MTPEDQDGDHARVSHFVVAPKGARPFGPTEKRKSPDPTMPACPVLTRVARLAPRRLPGAPNITINYIAVLKLLKIVLVQYGLEGSPVSHGWPPLSGNMGLSANTTSYSSRCCTGWHVCAAVAGLATFPFPPPLLPAAAAAAAVEAAGSTRVQLQHRCAVNKEGTRVTSPRHDQSGPVHNPYSLHHLYASHPRSHMWSATALEGAVLQHHAQGDRGARARGLHKSRAPRGAIARPT